MSLGLSEGKVLGILVIKRGLDANTDKVQDVMDLAEPKSKKVVMRLIRRMAAISLFVSYLAEKLYCFLSVTGGNKDFFRKRSHLRT